MIGKILSHIAASLSGHLTRVFELHEDLVILCAPGEFNGSSLPNKMVVSLVGVERETAAGAAFSFHASGQHVTRSAPVWQLNFYVLFSALFAEKQYTRGLSMFSESMCFIRSNAVLQIPDLHQKLTIEPVNLSFAELSNLWSICGGSYHPSILCKVRVIDIGRDHARGTAVVVTRKETGG